MENKLKTLSSISPDRRSVGKMDSARMAKPLTGDLLTVGSEMSSDSTTSVPATVMPRGLSIVWKAHIQNPTRLTESDAWPVGRPEFCGLSAPVETPDRNMTKTIQKYHRILPLSFTDFSKHRLSEKKAPRMTTVGRTTIPLQSQPRRGQRLLKTIPMGVLKVSPLQRSRQFEEFVKFARTQLVSISSTEKENLDKSSAGQLSSLNSKPNPQNGTKKRITEGRVRQSQRKPSTSQEHPSRISYSHLSTNTATAWKMEPIPVKSTVRKKVRHSLAALRSLRDYRIQPISTGTTANSISDSHFHPDNKSEQSTAQDTMIGERPFARQHLPTSLCPYVADLDSMHTGFDILQAKIREIDLKLPNRSPSSDMLRKLYTVTILDQHALKRMLVSKRLSALPKALRNLIRMGSLYHRERVTDIVPGELEAMNRQSHFCPIKEIKPDTALADVASLWIEAKVFTAELFPNWLSRMRPIESPEPLSEIEFDHLLRRTARSIRDHYTLPTSSSRLKLGKLLATSVTFPKLMTTLWNRLGDWMESLLGGLYSRERTVREETCYILAYLFTEPLLVDGIRQCSTYDIGYDAIVAVLHAIQMVPDSFLHFFCLLALMIEGCPMLSMLKAITDVGPTSGNVLLKHMWPRLIYYALKYWRTKRLQQDRMLLKMLNESMERAYVIGISRKNAKLAQIQLSKRFKMLTKPTTVWLNEWKKVRV